VVDPGEEAGDDLGDLELAGVGCVDDPPEALIRRLRPSVSRRRLASGWSIFIRLAR
jgi:hypothetical protein